MTLRLFLIALLVGLGPIGCHAREAPDDAFRAFTLAVLAHQKDLAWEHLSHESQVAMTAALGGASAAAPGMTPKDPKDLLFGGDVGLARPLDKVTIVDENASEAHLSVDAAGQIHRVRMVLEDGRWKLDLTDGLKL